MSDSPQARPTPKKRHKVFLSHNSADKPAVEALAHRLRQEEDIDPWLDKWNLIPGQPWQPEIEEAIRKCDSCVIFVGRGEPEKGIFGPWQNAEMRALISRQVENPAVRLPVIPLLLPGAERAQRSALPPFLVGNTWVEFRRSLDEAENYDRLLAGIRGRRPGPPSGERAFLAENPYRGLEFFDVGHSHLFFGREADTQWLVAELRKQLKPGCDLPRIIALLGASGSGKSSLARAGLCASLQADALEGSRNWIYAEPIRPGSNPLESLEMAMLKAAATSPQLQNVRGELRELRTHPRSLHRAARLLTSEAHPRFFLLVDQFEEVFTQCADDGNRKAFLDALLHAAKEPNGPVVIALTMRADFYPKIAPYEGFARAVEQHQVLIGPMDERRLREAIEEPALRAGAEFESGLVDTLLDDLRQQPGALPLLEHALSELWKRNEDGRKLTHHAYQNIGRIEGALEKHANEVFQALGPEDQDLCRRIFLRLVQPGEGAEDTRRRVTLPELHGLAEPKRLERVIGTLASPCSRLLVTQQDGPEVPGVAEVAHEALIRSWSQLRRWLDADRSGLRTHRRLTEASREWAESDRRVEFLYSGVRLAVARDWRFRNESDLSGFEREFLDASTGHEEANRNDALAKERERVHALELLANERDRAVRLERERAEAAELFAMAERKTYALLEARAKEVEETNRQLQASQHQLERTAIRLRDLDESKGRFFANISHELRTPLTLVIAPLESLRESHSSLRDPSVQDQLSTMHSNGMRLLRLINDLLELVRLDSGKLTLQTIPVSAEKFLESLLRSIRGVAEERGLRLSCVVAEDVNQLLADPDKLEKVFLNLLFNAVKFTSAGGEVAIHARRDKNFAVIEVRDTGVGISPEQLPYIFDRFWQADSSPRRKFQGAGIGLSLVKELVEAHGGLVGAESNLGQGTTIRVRLPLATGADVAGAPMAEPVDAIPDGWLESLYRRAEMFAGVPSPKSDNQPRSLDIETRKKPKLLLADDEPDMLRFLSSQFSPDYEVIEAVDGDQAFTLASQVLPEIIVCDYMMPGRDGMSVCRDLKRQSDTRGLPFLLLTARADEETKLRALAAGANDVLAKPFSPQELRLRIKNLSAVHQLQKEVTAKNDQLEAALERLRDTEARLVEVETRHAIVCPNQL
jgi:signal transduction histidine kinase/DNA-binding NarL/FixJ family response regulator